LGAADVDRGVRCVAEEPALSARRAGVMSAVAPRLGIS
jgi:hypothetical protein